MVVLAMVHLGDGVGLHQVLVGITDVVDDSEIRLQNRVPVSECRVELELVTQRRSSQSNVVTGSNTDLIQHVVVEVVPFGPTPGSSWGYTPSAVTRLFIPFLS